MMATPLEHERADHRDRGWPTRHRGLALKALIKPMVLLLIVALCLFEYVLGRESGAFRELEMALLQTQWMLLACLAVWCGTFLFLSFSLKDLPLIGLLVIAIVAYFISQAEHLPATDALTLLFGVTLGRATRFLLDGGSRRESAPIKTTEFSQSGLTSAATFLLGVVLLLAFSAFWHLDMTNNFYHGPRWMGLWNNPNDYGLLMSAGLVLAIGLLAAKRHKRRKRNSDFAAREHKERKDFPPLLANRETNPSPVGTGEGGRGPDEGCREEGKFRDRGEKSTSSLRSLRSFAAIKSALRTPRSAILLVAALMMGTGLLFSYSRGSWLGASVGLLYLAKTYGKFKWRSPKVFLFSAFCFVVLFFGAWFFWHTPRTAPWYFQRLDLSRGSAQHRFAAWKAGFEMMRDHPFGVGWSLAEQIYAKNYSPPSDGAPAITTNDYLMLGTQLGLPALICFVAYAALCLRSPKSRGSATVSVAAVGVPPTARSGPDEARGSLEAGGEAVSGATPETATGTVALPADLSPVTRHLSSDASLRVACRAGALAMLTAFWFDYGLFKLATAAVFWILLEVGSENRR